MYSRIKKVMLFSCAVFFVGNVSAEMLKLGVIDLHKVVANSSQVKAIKKQLETQFKPRQQKLLSMQDSLKSDVQELQREGSVMAQAKKKTLEAKIMKERQEMAQKGRAYEQELGAAQNKAMQQFFEHVKVIVDGIAKKEKYDLILQKEGLPFVDSKLEITDKVIAKL